MIIKSDESDVKIELVARDPQENLRNLLDYIKAIGNIGHTFSIVVDPGDNEREKRFEFDGDGSDHIFDIFETIAKSLDYGNESITKSRDIAIAKIFLQKVRDKRGRCHDANGWLTSCGGGGCCWGPRGTRRDPGTGGCPHCDRWPR